MATDSPFKRVSASDKQTQRLLPTLPSPSALETVASLKAAIPARAALSAFSQSLQQSTVWPAARSAFVLLDSVGSLQLDGEVIEVQSALQTGGFGSASLTRHVQARIDTHGRLSTEPVGSTLALELASALHGAPVSVRRRAIDQCDSSADNWHYAQLSPPKGAERLQALLEDWQAFVQQQSADLDPLLMACAAHGQWIALRPFTQSNIATGQLLSALLLCEEGLLPAPALPLALYFSRHADRYWEALYKAVAYGDHAGWIRFFMAAVVEASVDATAQVARWENHLQALTMTMHECLPKQPSTELILTCARPSFSLSDLAACGLTRRQTASSWMQKLMAADVLVEGRAGKEKRYINKAVVELLA